MLNSYNSSFFFFNNTNYTCSETDLRIAYDFLLRNMKYYLFKNHFMIYIMIDSTLLCTKKYYA